MKIIITAAILFLWAVVASQVEAKPVKVKGSFSKNGTYRKSHVRSAPDKSRLDNFGTTGRLNPVTGRPGKKKPFSR